MNRLAIASNGFVPAARAAALQATAVAMLLMVASNHGASNHGAWAQDATTARDEKQRDDERAGEPPAEAGDKPKGESEVNRVVPSRQLNVLREGLEQQLKELPPGKKADAIRRLLDQLSNTPSPPESRRATAPETTRSQPGPRQRSDVERMLAEIEFRVALQQYEHLLVRLRDLQIERALLEAEGLAEPELRSHQQAIDARGTILEQLRAQVAIQIGEMHDAMRAIGIDLGTSTPSTPSTPAAPVMPGTPVDRPRNSPTTIGGICLDDATGDPVPGVQIVVQRQSANANTGESKSEAFAVSKSDVQGRFAIAEQAEQLQRENVSLRMIFVKPGYQRSELSIDRSTPNLSNLQPRLKRGSSNSNRP